MKRTRFLSLSEDVYPSGIADLNTDLIQLIEGVIAQIAEHAHAAQSAVLTGFRGWKRTRWHVNTHSMRLLQNLRENNFFIRRQDDLYVTTITPGGNRPHRSIGSFA